MKYRIVKDGNGLYYAEAKMGLFWEPLRNPTSGGYVCDDEEDALRVIDDYKARREQSRRKAERVVIREVWDEM